MRIQPLSARRVETIRGERVTELFGDPDAKGYFQASDSYYGSGRFECDCADCQERWDRIVEMYDQR